MKASVHTHRGSTLIGRWNSGLPSFIASKPASRCGLFWLLANEGCAPQGSPRRRGASPPQAATEPIGTLSALAEVAHPHPSLRAFRWAPPISPHRQASWLYTFSRPTVWNLGIHVRRRSKDRNRTSGFSHPHPMAARRTCSRTPGNTNRSHQEDLQADLHSFTSPWNLTRLRLHHKRLGSPVR